MFGFSLEKFKETAELVKNQVSQQAHKARDAFNDTLQRRNLKSSDDLERFLVWQASQVVTQQNLVDTTSQWIGQIKKSKSSLQADRYELIISPTSSASDPENSSFLSAESAEQSPTDAEFSESPNSLTFFQVFLKSRALETILLTVTHNASLRSALGSTPDVMLPLQTLVNISLFAPEVYVDMLLKIWITVDAASDGYLISCLSDLVQRLKLSWTEDWLEEKQAELLGAMSEVKNLPLDVGDDSVPKSLDETNAINLRYTQLAKAWRDRRQLYQYRFLYLKQMDSVKKKRKQQFEDFVASTLASLEALSTHYKQERDEAAVRVAQRQGELLGINNQTSVVHEDEKKSISSALENAVDQRMRLLQELNDVEQIISSLTKKLDNLNEEQELRNQVAAEEKTKINSLIIRERMNERVASQGCEDAKVVHDLFLDPRFANKISQMLEELGADHCEVEKLLSEQRQLELDEAWAQVEVPRISALMQHTLALHQALVATDATRTDATAKLVDFKGDDSEKAELSSIAQGVQTQVYRLRRDLAKAANDLNEAWRAVQSAWTMNPKTENFDFDQLREEVKKTQLVVERSLEQFVGKDT